MNSPLKRNKVSKRSEPGTDYGLRTPFDREIQLPKLLGLWPSEVRDYSAQGTARLIALLQKAIRAERQRGKAGDWTYDLNRHLALAEALKAERLRLKALEIEASRIGRRRPLCKAAGVQPVKLRLAKVGR